MTFDGKTKDEAPREGWYPDPDAPQQLRWWNGTSWTEHTRENPDATETETTSQPDDSWSDPDENTRALIKDFRQRADISSFPTEQDRRPEWLKAKIEEQKKEKAKKAKRRTRKT